MTLPTSGPVERYAQLRAALDKRAFVAALPGPAVLIRLDERGGDDEPAPWAFHGSGLPLPVDVPSSDEDVFMDRPAGAPTTEGRGEPNLESTLTGPTFQLSIPAARGRATLLVIPKSPDVLIGRDAACDLVVAERSVSKNHARLLVDADSFTLLDLGSDNGVSVNGQHAGNGGVLPLSSGDVVELGDVSLLFLDASELWEGLPRLNDG